MTLEIFTLKDIADYFGVTKQYINKLKNEDPNFPEPAEKKGRIHLYTKKQVEAYEKIRDFKNPHTNRLERLKREGE
jgi:transcriptional regulator with XRE-family HTH domain